MSSVVCFYLSKQEEDVLEHTIAILLPSVICVPFTRLVDRFDVTSISFHFVARSYYKAA